MHSDPIADMLTRIRNAQAVKKTTVLIKFSNFNVDILNLLQKKQYIQQHKLKNNKIQVHLLYNKQGNAKIQHLKKISKPGRRVYAKAGNIPKVLNNYGFSVVSTSKGLMTNSEANAKKIGGEIICEVY